MPRTCTICQHPNREAIDAQIVASESNRMIANRFAISEASVQRHGAKHIPTQLAKAHDAEAVTQADGLLGQVRDLQSKALHILAVAEADGDLRTALAAIRETRGCLELLAKLLGELDDRPQINIMLSADWQVIRAAILTALAPHAAARVDVAAALLTIEGGAANGRTRSA